MANSPQIDVIELSDIEYDIDVKIDEDVLSNFTADGWTYPSEG